MPSDESVVTAKRECLAAAALAFAPATDVPRERALLRSAIASLVEAFGGKSFTKSDAIAEISKHGNLPELRPTVAEELFSLLISNSTLIADELGGPERHKFSPGFIERTQRTMSQVNGLVDSVVKDLFTDLSLTESQRESAREALMSCLARLMAAYGRQYAHQLAGKSDGISLLNRDDLVESCRQAASYQLLGAITPELMADAITELFARREPHFASFAFSLSQNYYYLRLLGLSGGLSQIAEDRFDGAEFFLDTNALMSVLFPESRHHRSMLELCELVIRLRASLHYSEKTLEEFKRVVHYNRTELARAFDEVPDSLVRSTRSVFLRAYRAAKEKDGFLTVESFFCRFDNIREQLSSEWDITALDQAIEGVDAGRLASVTDELRRCSLAVRKKGKGQAALDHDAHMFLLVLAERNRYGDKAAWLLTRDTSLPKAALQLQGNGETPYCMTLDGFLSILSPYVRADHQQSFAEMFVELLSRNLFPPEEVIELSDFRMFTDLELSVRRIPGEDVQAIIRKVKKAFGGDVESADRKLVAYEVQKALADPTLSYKVTLENEIKGLTKTVAERDAFIREMQAQQEQLQAQHSLETASIKADAATRYQELGRQVAQLDESVRGVSRELVCERDRGAKLEGRAIRQSMALRVLISGVLLVPIGVGVWWCPASLLGVFKSPALFQVGVSVASVLLWTSIASRRNLGWVISLTVGTVAAFIAIGQWLA